MTTHRPTPAQDDRSVLEVTDLVVSTTVDGRQVNLVDGVSFTVRRGESFCLVGESGSGKSLTMLAVMGLLPPGVTRTSGRIEFKGRDLTEAGEEELRQLRGKELAMVFQDPMTSLNPLRRVGRQIEDTIRIHTPHWGKRETAARVMELLRMVGVPRPNERAKAYPHQWSGGMRQRAMIAMAIAHDPELLIADEPTTALDVTIQAQVMSVLTEARRRVDSGMIMITHDLGLVAGVADRVAIMYSGKIVEEGSVYDVFSRPSHPYTIAALASIMTEDAERAYAIPGSPPLPARRPSGCAFAPRCPVGGEEEQCQTTIPELRPVNDGQLAACHLPRLTPIARHAAPTSHEILETLT